MTIVTINSTNRRERKKAAVRSQILDTAIQLFTQHGIDAVTVDQIADAADIGKGTVYNYFTTKEDIVVAFMVQLEAKVQADVSQLVVSRKSMEAILVDFIRHQLYLKNPYHKFVRVFLAQMFLRTEQFIPYMIEMQKAIDPPLQDLFLGLRQRGLLRTDVPLNELIIAFKSIQMGLSALWAIEGPPFRQTEKTLKLEMKLFCEGAKRHD
jgi:AcrR family transcriptional regulator